MHVNCLTILCGQIACTVLWPNCVHSVVAKLCALCCGHIACTVLWPALLCSLSTRLLHNKFLHRLICGECRLLFCYQNKTKKHLKQCIQCLLLHCLVEKGIDCILTRHVIKSWCLNVCNISLWNFCLNLCERLL